MIYLSCQHVVLEALQEVDHVIKDRALHGRHLSQLELAHGVTFCTNLELSLLQLQEELGKQNRRETPQKIILLLELFIGTLLDTFVENTLLWHIYKVKNLRF